MPKDVLHNPLLFGHNDEPGLVAVEHVPGHKGDDAMRLFIRSGDKTMEQDEPFRPFLWISEAALLNGAPVKTEIQSLKGKGTLKYMAGFNSWKDFQKMVAWLKQATGRNPSDITAPFYALGDPVQQHLLRTGRTLFKNMLFSQLRRMQVDIETYCESGYEFSNSAREGDRIIAIALSDQTGWTGVISGKDLDEKSMLERWVNVVRERDPDVIEGHNLFKFDLPYLFARAKRHRIRLKLGRDGSEPRTRSSRYIVAEQTIAYTRVELFGRHIVDTYFLAQAYDVSHRALESLSLKDVAVHFGVSPPGRTYIEGADIAQTFDKNPALLMKYAGEDVVETRAVSAILSPSYFVQAQMLPFTFQNICVRGSGAKIDSLLLREYLRAGHALPTPDTARDFAGGYTDIFYTGVARNVHHCDVRSLYPSLMLKDRIGPRSDELNIFLSLLRELRDFRLDARKRMLASKDPDEKNHLDALQTTFKILINSFYGYLGFSQGRFNDYAMAEKVAAEGRALLKKMIEWIRKHDGQPVEIDTDGIYFVPPPVKRPAQLEAFRRGLQESLPEGIDVEFDGEYVAMFSYKMKNYALLDPHGEITIKGAALKSRGLEPFQRDYLSNWLKFTLEGRAVDIEKLKTEYRDAVASRKWPIRTLAKTETLQDSPATYAGKIGEKARGRNAAYELALKSGREYRAGDQISYYVTGDKKSVAVHTSAKQVSEWDANRRDENVTFYLAKLDALIAKFDAIAHGEIQRELELDDE